MEEIELRPIWSDSMGAKSMCIRVDTEDMSLMIDPGAAIMQKSYPLDVEEKNIRLSDARREIENAALDCDDVIVTHYHYDHHFLPEAGGIDFFTVFEGKNIWIKDPNRWINRSQWERAREFVEALYKKRGGDPSAIVINLEREPDDREYKDPLNELPMLHDINEGDYGERREELHEKWRKKFWKRVDMWREEKHIEEPDEGVHFADGEEFKRGGTTIRMTEPLFHGIEYSNTGWIIAVIVEKGGEKLLYTSDIQGPTIEDYAEWIIDEDPDLLVMDGPATYLLGYMLNKFNLNRAVKNASRIIEECDFETMLYDHHLMRDKKFRERTEEFWKSVEDCGKKVISYREYIEGKDPLIEEL